MPWPNNGVPPTPPGYGSSFLLRYFRAHNHSDLLVALLVHSCGTTQKKKTKKKTYTPARALGDYRESRINLDLDLEIQIVRVVSR